MKNEARRIHPGRLLGWMEMWNRELSTFYARSYPLSVCSLTFYEYLVRGRFSVSRCGYKDEQAVVLRYAFW